MSAVWKEHGYDEYILVGDDGQIITRIIRMNGYGPKPSEYIVGGYGGKRYISLEQAKQAAENQS